MNKITVNELLVLVNRVKERKNNLKQLQQSVSTKDFFYHAGEETKVREPQYDVKALDKKMVELDLFILKAESAIKTSNAFTEIEIEADVDKLFSPVE